MTTEWTRLPTCDLCTRAAIWRHPLGGLRCGKCPRPEAAPAKAKKARGR